jgi:hypothetical protein
MYEEPVQVGSSRLPIANNNNNDKNNNLTLISQLQG